MGMTPTPVSLLERLRQPHNQQAWDRFAGLYTPLVFRWACQTGLQESDACDLVQEVFVVLLQKMPDYVYDRRGSFRAWLKTVTVNKWRDHCRRLSARREGHVPAPEIAVSDGLEAFWNAEYRRQVVGQALRLMQADFEPQTWQACWHMVVDNEPAAAIAKRLGIKVGTVYAAKCRVLARLREELAGLLD
jgi:RNA polymerase sigma-70 factor (ECF subfamily)